MPESLLTPIRQHLSSNSGKSMDVALEALTEMFPEIRERLRAILNPEMAGDENNDYFSIIAASEEDDSLGVGTFVASVDQTGADVSSNNPDAGQKLLFSSYPSERWRLDTMNLSITALNGFSRNLSIRTSRFTIEDDQLTIVSGFDYSCAKDPCPDDLKAGLIGMRRELEIFSAGLALIDGRKLCKLT